MRRGVKPTLVFDSKFTSYAKLSKLNAEHDVKFITLRRRGKNMIEQAEELDGWHRTNIPHDKRKYPNPQVHESVIALRDYDGKVRQVIMRGKGIVEVDGHTVNVIYPRRAHNPILRQVPWHNLPLSLPGQARTKLNLIFS